MSEGTIVERLQTQRTLLVDVVRQIDTAIAAFGGVVAANGNGNGRAPAKIDGRGWWKTATAAEKQRVIAKRNATKRKNRQAHQQTPQFTETL